MKKVDVAAAVLLVGPNGIIKYEQVAKEITNALARGRACTHGAPPAPSNAPILN